jgi:hypothetical protein
MRIYWLQQFWFGDVVYNDTDNHPHYGTIRFEGRPNIDAQAWLTTLSPGAKFSGGAVTAIGGAAVRIVFAQFVDDQGFSRTETTFGNWESHIRLSQAIIVQWEFNVRLAWAKAEGMIYWWESTTASPDFQSPNYIQEHWRIFDRATGKILATETIWTAESAEGYERGPSANLLEQFGTDSEGRPVEVDAIEADHPPAADERVDVSRRALVREPAPESQDTLRPEALFGR